MKIASFPVFHCVDQHSKRQLCVLHCVFTQSEYKTEILEFQFNGPTQSSALIYK